MVHNQRIGGFLCLLLVAFISHVSVSVDAQSSATLDAISANTQSEKQRLDSLESVKPVDDLPLYEMQYYGDYDLDYVFQPDDIDVDESENGSAASVDRSDWGCSLFVAHSDGKQTVYGRNFDWYDHPAIILSTNPSNGYASVSLVDVSYLGYSLDDDKFDSIDGRQALLRAPLLPFDGMNEKGLVVGMAAVGNTVMPRDESKPDTGGLRIIRRILDQAATLDEALEIFDQFNIVFEGGPNIHYLISDAHGNSALIELLDGKKSVHRNGVNWHSATNFYYTGNETNATDQCWRFKKIDQRMNQDDGSLSVDGAFRLLKDVAQDTTRWSAVYETQMDQDGEPVTRAHVVTKRRFGKIHEFSNSDQENSSHYFSVPKGEGSADAR